MGIDVESDIVYTIYRYKYSSSGVFKQTSIEIRDRRSCARIGTILSNNTVTPQTIFLKL
jgi:hypothetical protein